MPICFDLRHRVLGLCAKTAWVCSIGLPIADLGLSFQEVAAMTELNARFAPDWVSPPGDSIFELYRDHGWTEAKLARQMECSDRYIHELVHGQVAITVAIAEKLARVLGGSVDFWLNREVNFQRHKARIQIEQQNVS